jgi:hypothetical protein
MTSLKASKKAIASPSKAELVLDTNTILSLAPVASEASQAYGLYEKQAEATLAYRDSEASLADEFYTWLVAHKPDYKTYQAVKKHITTSLASSKGRKFETVEKWLNAYVIKEVKALGYELPKAESKSAQGMANLRSELSALSDTDIVTQIAELAKQGASGDKEALKRATQLASEKQKREKQEANAIKKADSKATTELKGALKRWITGLEHEQLAALLWAKNHFNEVTKLAKQAK